MKKVIFTCSIFLCLFIVQLKAQNIFPSNGSAGIGTTTPNASSAFEMNSTTKGLLISRMTLAQRNAIPSPASGLMIYQTTNTPGFYYYNGTSWIPISTNGANTSLSNLKSPTAINVNLLPGTSGNIDLGAPAAAWRNIYFNGSIFYGSDRALSINGSNAALGLNALYSNTTGFNNTANGLQALYSNTTGYSNTANGLQALYANTTGYGNTANGYGALFSSTTANLNTASGYQALFQNTKGYGNTASGNQALYHNTTGYSNVAVGVSALFANSTRSNLVAIGDSALFNNGTGALNSYEAINNVAIGSKSLYFNTTGRNNTGNGYQALYSNSIGAGNTATGSQALLSNTSGNGNAAFGNVALSLNTTGSDNTALGFGSLAYNTTGALNTAVGSDALDFNTTGNYNVAVGELALGENTTGGGNTALGTYSLYHNSVGTSNTAIGSWSLSTLTTGTNNTVIGASADVSTGALTNSTAIGCLAVVNASNKAVIGNNSVTVIGGHVGWSILSDGRFKNNIKENVPGLEFINKLRPVTYNIDETKLAKFIGVKDSLINVDKDAYSKVSQKLRTGFVAQEVEKIAQQINYDFDGINHPQTDKDNYSLVYADFVPSLVKAVQQLSKQNEGLQREIDTLKTLLTQKGATTAIVNSSTNSSAQTQVVDLGSSIKLEQNTPNPFNAGTTIKYFLPVNSGNVYINFYNNSGALLKSVKLNGTGNGNIIVNAHDLSSGSYHYTLTVDGRITSSKQMEILK